MESKGTGQVSLFGRVDEMVVAQLRQLREDGIQRIVACVEGDKGWSARLLP
jgi:hypothetical protein